MAIHQTLFVLGDWILSIRLHFLCLYRVIVQNSEYKLHFLYVDEPFHSSNNANRDHLHQQAECTNAQLEWSRLYDLVRGDREGPY